MNIDIKDIEEQIRDIFEENYEFIKAEGGHSITDFIKEEAYSQVLYYFRKNIELIKKITEAEVKLTLPEKTTPNQNLKYTIEGVIDIVREGDETWDPVIPLGYTEDEIETMIAEFGKTVENIENNHFTAPPVEKLFEKEEGKRNIFAVRICRNCDAGFSCSSFREYVRQSDRGNQGLRKYLNDYGIDFSTEDFIEGNLLE